MNNIIDCLQNRDFIEAISGGETSDSTDNTSLRELTQSSIVVYAGFDPTAESLHLGNLVTIICLKWFQMHGHTPLALIGGATGMVGDPSGKSIERPMLTPETIQKNMQGIRKNLEAILDFDHPTAPAKIINNYDWFQNFSYIDFLREVGKNFRLGPMLAKESVKARLQSPTGLSYTEFSYQVLQAYDFLHLYKNYNVQLQIGGSDQWGNITAGTELVRKISGAKVYGLTFPLLTRSDGKKFGKSEEGAIWLAAKMLSPYQFYQYLFNTPDSDVIKLMKMLTFMDMEEINQYEQDMQQQKSPPNTTQKRLAEELTLIVHGEQGLETARKVTAGAAPGKTTKLDIKTLEAISQDMPSGTYSLNEIVGKRIVDVFTITKLTSSKGEARRLIKNGGTYLNNVKVSDENYIVSPEDALEGRLLLLGVGKKKKMIVHLIA